MTCHWQNYVVCCCLGNRLAKNGFSSDLSILLDLPYFCVGLFKLMKISRDVQCFDRNKLMHMYICRRLLKMEVSDSEIAINWSKTLKRLNLVLNLLAKRYFFSPCILRYCINFVVKCIVLRCSRSVTHAVLWWSMKYTSKYGYGIAAWATP